MVPPKLGISQNWPNNWAYFTFFYASIYCEKIKKMPPFTFFDTGQKTVRKRLKF
jgi:hypothetical protein